MILMASALSVSPSSSFGTGSLTSSVRAESTAAPNPREPFASTLASQPSPLNPFVNTTVTATKTHTPSGNRAPGDILTYTVVITNTGGADATGVIFTDTIDPNTTLVPGSVNSSPVAFDDSYTASGNIPIAPATSVLANDIDPDSGTNAGLTVTEVQGAAGNVGNPTNTTATGIGGVHGSVTLLANGTFTYQPPPGFTGADTFSYQISDAGGKTSTATVTITISNMVWFIDNTSAAANSRGTFTEPFKTIAAFNAVNTGAAPNPQPGHHVVLRPASGSYAEADGINLQNTQTLTGPAVAFNTVFTADANSTSAYNTFAASTGTAAAITATAGNGVDLGSGNALRGFNIGNTPGFFGVNGTVVGSLTVATVSKTGTGGAMSVSTSGTFGATVNFGTFESGSSATSNLNLVGVTGTLGVGSAGAGFTGSAAASAAINISGGSVSLTYAGNVTKATTGALLSVAAAHSGTLIFNTGTLNASSGTGLQFDNADGTYNFNGTNTLVGGDAGVDILNGSSGTFTFSSTSTITSPTGTAFNVNASSPSVTYSGNITQNTAAQRVINIDTTASNTILFQTGTITGGPSSTGVNINAATGNVTFSNGMTMGTSGVRMTNTAVTINTGAAPAIYNLGIVSIFTTGAAKGILSTNTGGEIRTTAGSVVDAAGAAAIDITAAASTPLMMALTKVSANGGANGIRLTNTTGSFTITGDGASDPANTTRGRTTAKQGGGIITLGSGGTILNTTAPGVALSNAANVTLRNLSLTGNAGGLNSGADGINAASLSGLTLDNVLVTGHLGNDGFQGSGLSALNVQHTDMHTNGKTAGAEGTDNWDVHLDNLTGTCTMLNSLFFDSREEICTITNGGSSNVNLTVTNSEFRDTDVGTAPAVGDAAFQLLASGSAVTTLTATGSTFSNARLTGFHYTGNNTTSGTVKVMNSTFGGVSSDQNGVDIDIDHQGQGTTLNFEVSGNTTRQGVRATTSNSINIFLAGLSTATSQMIGTVKNNIVGNAGQANSGSGLGAGIALDCTGAGTMTATVTGNTVTQVEANSGNVFDLGLSQTAKANLKIRNNTFNGNPAQVNPQYGLHINVGTGTPGEVNTLCMDMGANSVTMPASAIASVDLDVFPGGNANLIGYGGAANNVGQITTFLGTPNNTVATPAANYTAAGGSTQAAVAPCSTFVFPTFADPGPITQSANPISDGPPESSTESGDALRATWGESPNPESAEKLNSQVLSFAVQAAIERWRQAGISAEDLARLQAVSFEIADLPGDLLALSTAQIKIDETAAGYGWYVDAFPLDDSNFQVLVPNKELQTNEASPANGKMDLLTVVMRELGNVFLQGQTKVTKRTRENLRPLMEDTLSPGVRRMPLDLLRVTPLSPIGSTLPAASDRLLAQSSVTIQPDATQGASLLADAQAGNIAANVTADSGDVPAGDRTAPARVRYAVFNPAKDRRIPTAAVMRFNSASDARSYAAIRARRVGSASPFSGETVTVNGSGSGFTIPVGKSVTIMFQATINNPFPPNVCTVTNPATGSPANVTGTNFPSVTIAPDSATIAKAPTIGMCPTNITKNTDPNVCTAVTNFTPPTSDACPAATVTCVPASGFAFAKGTTTVTCTAANGVLPNATCTFTVTVNDNQPPVLSGCTNQTINAGAGVCTATATYAPTATDNCDGARPVTCIPASGSTFNQGVTTVTCSASDLNTPTPNTGMCMFTITVNDTQPPVVTCPAAGGAFAAADCLPSQSSAYTGATLYSAGSNTVTNAVLSNFTPCTPPPVSGMATINFTGILTGDLTIPPTGPTHFQAPVTGSMKVTFNNLTGSTRTFDTEMLQLDISGGNLPAGVLLRESPTLTSTGQTKITTVTGGFHIDSFFDVFTELSTDGGATWTPDGAGSPRHIAAVQSTDAGACNAVVNYPAATATDNCPGVSAVTCVPASGTTFAKGTTTVTCSATDAGNLTGNCSFTVTVIDTQLPTLTCPSNISVIGNVCQVETYTTPTASDNCPGAAVSCSPASGSCFAVGTTTVTCTATDTSANTNSCTFTVTVTPCTITCPNNITQNADAGVCTTVVTYSAPTTTGSCGTVSCSPVSGSTFQKGVTTVTCSTTAGPSCSFTVTVNDTQPPMITCPGPVTHATDPNVCTAVVTFAAPTVTDNCPPCQGTLPGKPGGSTQVGCQVVCVPASGATFPKGVTTVTCTATDASNNTANCSFTVTVNDTQAPSITCPVAVVQSTDPNVCTAVVSYSNATATDNCPGVGTPVCTPASGTTFQKGVTTVSCSVSDASNNSANCSFTVTVNDTQPPTVTCPLPITKNTDPNVCTAVVTFADPTVTDNCPPCNGGGGTKPGKGPQGAVGCSVVCVPASGTAFQKGVTTVTCTATDASNNQSQCSFTVTINDMQAPSITCPTPITQSTDPNVCTAVVSFTPTVTDNCPLGPTPVVCTPASGATFQKGVTTVSCTATDTSSNTANCSFTVTVNDTQAPSISCPANITQPAAMGLCSAVVTYSNATATDNCAGVGTPSCVPASGSTFQKGVTTVTCTVHDASNNPASCTFTVTINDTQPPVITCPANVTKSTDPNVCTAVVTYPNATATDNCAGVGTPVCTPASGTTFQKGVTTVSCSVSDAATNTANCTFTVTVNDTQNPTVTCPANITFTTPGNNDPCGTVTYTTPSGSDNCAVQSVNCTPASGTCFPVGMTTVTCTATDTSGNHGTCTFKITVQNPCTITCPANITKNNDANQCGAVVMFMPTTTGGGCGTVACSPSSGSFFPKGTTTVTCTTAGPSCSFTVTVNDTQPPNITCPANIVHGTDPGVCQAVVTYPAPVVSDNCPGVGAPTCSPASGTTFPKGTTTVTCSVKDSSNNMSMCSFTVTVNDTEPPVFPNGCPGGIIKAAQATCPFTTTLIVNYTIPVATDNCGPPPTVVCNPPSGSTFPPGTTVITCIATDSSGNTATCTFPVNIFSFCLQDDSSDGNVVFVNALTGDYLFCQNGAPLASGKGTLVTHGCNFQIDHTKGDRKVHIQGDTSAASGAGAGTAYIQKLGGGIQVLITDRRMNDDACTCAPLAPPPAPPPPKKKNQG
jgi:uncharacterized repeat protein (TIGR01451 family)